MNIITIDASSFVVRLEIDEVVRETRLKPYHVEILYGIFSYHPEPLSYEEITKRLKAHNLVVADLRHVS